MPPMGARPTSTARRTPRRAPTSGEPALDPVKIRRDYNAGREGATLPAGGDPGAYADGASDAARGRPTGSKAGKASKSRPVPPATAEGAGPAPHRRTGAGSALPLPKRLSGDPAGVIVGMLGYALLWNALAGGPAQVRRWLAAKFLNRTSQSGTPLSATDAQAAAMQRTASSAVPPGLRPPSSGSPLEPIDQLVPLRRIDGAIVPGDWLRADAAAAYQRAQGLAGKNIPLTGAYRTFAEEAQGHRDHPERFPAPSKDSQHVIGNAVDVWNNPIGGGIAPSQDPSIIAALEQAGFRRFDPGNKRGEAMHWSYLVAK